MASNSFASVFVAVMLLVTTSVQGQGVNEASLGPRVSRIQSGPGVQYELQARLIDAVPGDVIQLEAGTYRLLRQLDVVTDNLTIRGAGSGETIISFKGQTSGNAGLEATGDNLWLEGLAIEDTAGNAIKILGADGVTLRDVRVEWTGPAAPTNGAYGLYPVQCENVLIDKCVAIGASDAGIYVGQSRNVIVRNSHAERNVAGIEIENTINADVYENIAINNTGGVLVFDLPGLQVTNGRHVRVFNNIIKDNNHKNFAAEGAMVATVPPGTGVMVMATDHVEVFDNEISDHQTGGVAILSFGVSGKKVQDKSYDQFPESVHIHDNRISNSGYQPKGALARLLGPVIGDKFPDILWDGLINPEKMQANQPAVSQLPTIVNNGQVRFANFDFGRLNEQNISLGKYKVKRDLAAHAAVREMLTSVTIAQPKAISKTGAAAVQVYRSAKQRLSEYGLFVGELADQTPTENVVPYELNTPLFSDYTRKYRFIRLPDGTQIEYRDKGVMEFPVGTVIAKTFSYPHDMTDLSKGERLLETRIELRLEDNWYGFSYLWNEEQTNATLVLGGAELDVSWIHSDGETRQNQYQVPNANQCITCHQSGDKFVPIGPVASNMNREFDYGDGSKNQLTYLADRELLAGAPTLSEIHSWPTIDSNASLDSRARTWLHVNCAHCHNPEGTARPSGLDLRISQQEPAKLGVWKTPVAAGHGTGGNSYDIVPGKPNESILLYRIKSTDPSVTMPNVAKSLIPKEAAQLVSDWIQQIPPSQ